MSDDRPKLGNLSDPDVLAMAERNHQPTESWQHGYAGVRSASVSCDMCEQSWPCATIVEVRRITAEQRSR